MGASTGPKQHTLSSEVVVSGKGLLLGEYATVTIRPAPENHGIVFERVDLSPPVQIPASVQHLAQIINLRSNARELAKERRLIICAKLLTIVRLVLTA